MLPTKFRFIRPSGFRGEDFLKIGQSEKRIACGSHVWWPSQVILVSDWLISKKSSPLKPCGQMNQNLVVGSILGRFSIKFAHLVQIR
jgi:hypothetical protein